MVMVMPFFNTAKLFMAMRECLIPDRRSEAQEEVIADLHTCLEQLIQRSTEMESKIDMCMQRAACHMKASKRETTMSAKNRELSRAKMYMEDKRRIQGEYDKTQKSIHMLQQQIDCIVSSHTDMVIVDTMRHFNATAARLSLPNKTAEVETLGEELTERQSEVTYFQEAMQGMSLAMGGGSNGDDAALSDDLLMQELEDYMQQQDEPKMVMTADSISIQSSSGNNVNNKGKRDEPTLVMLPSVPNHIFSLRENKSNDSENSNSVAESQTQKARQKTTSQDLFF